jgi:hypothetical protein
MNPGHVMDPKNVETKMVSKTKLSQKEMPVRGGNG